MCTILGRNDTRSQDAIGQFMASYISSFRSLSRDVAVAASVSAMPLSRVRRFDVARLIPVHHRHGGWRQWPVRACIDLQCQRPRQDKPRQGYSALDPTGTTNRP